MKKFLLLAFPLLLGCGAKSAEDPAMVPISELVGVYKATAFSGGTTFCRPACFQLVYLTLSKIDATSVSLVLRISEADTGYLSQAIVLRAEASGNRVLLYREAEQVGFYTNNTFEFTKLDYKLVSGAPTLPVVGTTGTLTALRASRE